MTRLILPALAAALALGGAAHAQGDARTYPLAGFDRIAVSGCDDVSIMPGTGFAVSARGDARAIAALRLSVRGGTLHVDRAPRTCSGHAPHATVAIAMPRVVEIGSEGTGNVSLRGARGPSLRIDLSGTGGVTLTDVAADRLALDLSGTGAIRAAGTVRSAVFDLSGTGDIDTRRLDVAALTVRASGTGEVTARATQTAQVDASGTGDVTITGHPRCAVDRSGTASVSCD